MTKVEKFQKIVNDVLTECSQKSPMLTMLKPFLMSFISQVKEHDIDVLIKIMKAIIRYLEEDVEGVKKHGEGKETISVN